MDKHERAKIERHHNVLAELKDRQWDHWINGTKNHPQTLDHERAKALEFALTLIEAALVETPTAELVKA